MRYHKKTYEDVFSVDHEKSRQKLNLEEITLSDMELDEYTLLFHNFLTDFYSDLFFNCVRLSWLRRKFTYYGKKTILPMYKNSRILNNSFVKFVRRNVGKDLQIITRGKYFSKIESYFNEMFPDFLEGNPFEDPDYYIFPYKNISIDFLMVVHQLDDRMDLLQYADNKNMSFAVFLDYVINHTYTENELLGRQRYEMQLNQIRNSPLYIRDTDKKTHTQKGKKRI